MRKSLSACLLVSGTLWVSEVQPLIAAPSDIDCSPLDPRVQLSTETEGRVKASAETLYKIAKAQGAIEGKVKNVQQNLQAEVPLSEKANAQNRLAYLFCELFAKDNTLSAEKKYQLYEKLVDRYMPEKSSSVSAASTPPAF